MRIGARHIFRIKPRAPGDIAPSDNWWPMVIMDWLCYSPSVVTNGHVSPSPARAGVAAGACAIPQCSPPVRSSDGQVLVMVAVRQLGTRMRCLH